MSTYEITVNDLLDILDDNRLQQLLDGVIEAKHRTGGVPHQQWFAGHAEKLIEAERRKRTDIDRRVGRTRVTYREHQACHGRRGELRGL